MSPVKLEQSKPSLASIPVYPILLTAYPILSLLAYNLGEIRWQMIIRSLAVGILVVLVLMAVLYIILRDLHKAAFVAGSFSFLFFTYGHLRLIQPEAAWTRPAVLMPLWTGLFLLILVMVYRTKINLGATSLILNVIWLMLTAFSIMQVVPYERRLARFMEISRAAAPASPTSMTDPGSLPDIYYFILDSYTRADTLQAIYGYDNSEFLNELESMGFFIASCSQSNFDRTELSLASSLNMDYLQSLLPELKPDSHDRVSLWAMIQHSRVRQTLEGSGYQTVSFATGYAWSELTDADQFIQPDLPFTALSEFELLLLRTTFMNALQETGLVNYQAQEYTRYSERTHLILARLPEMSAQPGPQFYFVHILDPHPPFVFNADGTQADAGAYLNPQGRYPSESYARGYINELQFINREMLNLIPKLIEGSSVPPVIIIQGDHGPWLQPPQYTMPILNAYYLGSRSEGLYPAITPVNTFRIVFNEYLGTNFSLLEDHSYDSPIAEPYNYSLVPNPCP